MAEKKNLNIQQSIAYVMANTTHVEKGGENKFQKYKYHKEYDVYVAIRKHMADVGLVAVQHEVELINTHEYLTRKEETRFLVTVHVKFRFIAADGSELEVQAIGQGADEGDKAVYKALTGAEKYAMQKTFKLPSSEGDPEDDSNEKENQNQVAGRTRSSVGRSRGRPKTQESDKQDDKSEPQKQKEETADKPDQQTGDEGEPDKQEEKPKPRSTGRGRGRSRAKSEKTDTKPAEKESAKSEAKSEASQDSEDNTADDEAPYGNDGLSKEEFELEVEAIASDEETEPKERSAKLMTYFKEVKGNESNTAQQKLNIRKDLLPVVKEYMKQVNQIG